jgi:uncharacterized membrane protein
MKFSWRVELPQLLAIAAMFAAAALLWSGAPDRIPIHWDLNGQVDGYGGKFSGLVLLPLISLGTYAFLLVLPRIDPGKANYMGFTGAYTAIRVSVLGVLVVIYAATIRSIQAHSLDMGSVAPLALSALIVVLGSVMGKLRPNWFVGVRTPWTLSSKIAWVRTHRAGGWVFVVTGLLSAAACLVSNRAGFWVMSVGLLGGGVALIVYSHWVWRNDPDKVAPAGTSPAP